MKSYEDTQIPNSPTDEQHELVALMSNIFGAIHGFGAPWTEVCDDEMHDITEGLGTWTLQKGLQTC